MDMFTIVGTTTLDVIITAPDEPPGQDGDEFTTESLMFCEEPFDLLLGGNGANSAYILASLGTPTTLYSAVGDDLPGHLLRGWLEEVNVDLSDIVIHPDEATSSTAVISDEHYNRRAFHHHGSSAAFGPEQLSRSWEDEDDVLLITGYPLLSRWRSQNTSLLLKHVRQNSVVTALDIGPAVGEPAELNELRPLLPHVDYLLCNSHEASVCTETSSIAASCRKLRDAGAQTIVIKQGPRGASFLAPETNAPVDVNGFSVDVRQTVGAGDSFNAGFLYACHHDYSLHEAVQFANALAALVVASGRGVMGCPTRRQIRHLLMQQ